MMPGSGGGPRPSPFGGSSQGYRRNWDNPPEEKKPDDKKVEEKKPAVKTPAKEPAKPEVKKSEPAKKPEPEKKSEGDKKPTPPQKEARVIDVEVWNSIRTTVAELAGQVRPLFDVRMPTVSLSMISSLLADEPPRPAPPPPPPPRDGVPGHGFGEGRGPDGPHGHGGPSHGGRSFGPWGHFDPERFKEVDPELYGVWKEEHELEKKTFELGEQYRRTKDSAEKEKLKKELAEQVAKHFDVRQKKRELELKRFAEHLERMKASIAKRQEAKESIIKERVDELTGEEPAKF
jgi:hypothetical protein